jgi:hypothetical protein
LSVARRETTEIIAEIAERAYVFEVELWAISSKSHSGAILSGLVTDIAGKPDGALYNLMKAKQLPYIKIGKRTLLKISDIEVLLENGREVRH